MYFMKLSLVALCALISLATAAPAADAEKLRSVSLQPVQRCYEVLGRKICG